MPSYTINAQNGSTVQSNRSDHNHMYHQITIKPNTGGAIAAGTLKIQGRAQGDDTFRDIPDATEIDLTVRNFVNFTGGVAEYKFLVSGYSGTATSIHITDNYIGDTL